MPKSVVRWSGATSRQRQRFGKETQDRRGRAMRERNSENGGCGRVATATSTQWTRCVRDAESGKGARLEGRANSGWSQRAAQGAPAESESGGQGPCPEHYEQKWRACESVSTDKGASPECARAKQRAHPGDAPSDEAWACNWESDQGALDRLQAQKRRSD